MRQIYADKADHVIGTSSLKLLSTNQDMTRLRLGLQVINSGLACETVRGIIKNKTEFYLGLIEREPVYFVTD